MLLLNSSDYQIISWTLDPVVIVAIVALLGTVISGLISFKVARHTASQEIQKLEITWKHQDSKESEEAFRNLVSDVYTLVVFPTRTNLINACTASAIVVSLDGKPAASANRLLVLLVNYLFNASELTLSDDDKQEIIKALYNVIYDNSK